MAIDLAGWTMGGPASVSNRDLLKERLLLIDVGVGDELLEASDFTNVLEEENRPWLVSVDADTCERNLLRMSTTMIGDAYQQNHNHGILAWLSPGRECRKWLDDPEFIERDQRAAWRI